MPVRRKIVKTGCVFYRNVLRIYMYRRVDRNRNCGRRQNGDGLIVRPEAARSCVTARHRSPSLFSIRDRSKSIGFQSLT